MGVLVGVATDTNLLYLSYRFILFTSAVSFLVAGCYASFLIYELVFPYLTPIILLYHSTPSHSQPSSSSVNPLTHSHFISQPHHTHPPHLLTLSLTPIIYHKTPFTHTHLPHLLTLPLTPILYPNTITPIPLIC